jgi:ADP-ribosylglycohydrolase
MAGWRLIFIGSTLERVWHMALKDKILGGLFGQALGDAWGMPAYFDIDLTWNAFGGWIDTLVPAPDDHPVH